jgi:hypothetical protein
MKIIWNRAGGLPECPYFKIWAIISKRLGSIRLHNWLGDDDHRHMHTHPYWFVTFVLRGGYDDVTETGVERVRAFTWRYRAANHLHSVQNVIPNSWTLLITGPAIQRWGFKVGDKIIKRDKYFATQGHHPCDMDGTPVRMKPGGERV